MTNILVRTSIATLTALTVSAGALALSTAPAAAAPIKSQDYVQLVGGKHHGKQGHRAHNRHQRLYPQQVVRILERRGFHNVRRMYFSHGKYYARANGRHGPMKLVVSANSGQILNRERLSRPHRHDRNRHQNYGRPHGGYSWSFTFGR